MLETKKHPKHTLQAAPERTPPLHMNMSKTGRTPSKSVFIGNIAYESTREQLTDIFSEVGPVINLRIVTDRETGRPKGYAFCEFKDEASALSAMRNLNGRELNGRSLRVDYADGADRGGGGGHDDDQGAMGQQQMKPVDPVMGALMQLPKNQLYEAAAQMKHLVMTNPERARQILTQNPTMALVMLHIQYLLGMATQPWTPQQGHVATKPDFAQSSILGMPPPNVRAGASIVGPPTHNAPMGAPSYYGAPQGPNVSGPPRHTGGVPGTQLSGPYQQGGPQQPGTRGGPGMGGPGAGSQPSFYGGQPQQPQPQQQQPQQQQPQQQQPQQQQPQQPQQGQYGPPQQQQQQPTMQLSREQFQSMVQNIPQDTLTEIIKVTPQQLQQLPPQERQQVMLIQHHMRMYAPALLGGQRQQQQQ